jgi:hypothetical protein
MKTAALLMGLSLMICAAATILGTMAAMDGNWDSWLLDCFLFAVGATCYFVNRSTYRNFCNRRQWRN